MKAPLFRTLGLLAPILALIVNTSDKLTDVDYAIPFKILIGLACLAGLLVILADWVGYWKNRPKKYRKNSPEINHYMQDWLQKGGRCLILSRNMSWVEDMEFRLLRTKAASGDLELVVGERTPTITRLEDAGAKVFDYSQLNFVPSSRFTIIDYDKSGEQIAIGKGRNGKHLITEHSKNDDDVFVLAKDLKNALKAACENG